MCKKAEKAKGLRRLIRLFLDPLFWYVIMIPLAFVYVGAVEVRSDVSEFMFPILYVSEISALVSSFRIAFIRGLKFRTIICPFLLGAMMFIVFYVGNNLYAILHHPNGKLVIGCMFISHFIGLFLRLSALSSDWCAEYSSENSF